MRVDEIFQRIFQPITVTDAPIVCERGASYLRYESLSVTEFVLPPRVVIGRVCTGRTVIAVALSEFSAAPTRSTATKRMRIDPATTFR
jgi:hypothetical protein